MKITEINLISPTREQSSLTLSRHRTEDQTCYNCGKRAHISPACPESRKEWIHAEQTQGTLEDMIAKSMAAALDAHEVAQKKEKDLKGKDGQGFPGSQQ